MSNQLIPEAAHDLHALAEGGEVSAGIARVLAEHYEYNWNPDAESWECQCGHLLGEDVFRRDADPNHRAHQAALLAPLFAKEQAAGWRK